MREVTPPPTGPSLAECPFPEATSTPAALALREWHHISATPREREAAAARMLEAYRPWVNAHLRSWPRARPEDVEDALSETLRRFYAHCPAHHPNPEALLRTIFGRILIDQFRRQLGPNGDHQSLDAQLGDELLEELAEAVHHKASDTAELAWRRDLLSKAQDLVERLRPQDLTMFLRYANEEEPEAIASELGIKIGTLRQRISYLRRYLRKALKLQTSGDLA